MLRPMDPNQPPLAGVRLPFGEYSEIDRRLLLLLADGLTDPVELAHPRSA